MDTLMSLPMTASVLTEYGDLEEACRSCGCDGLEVVWGGEELPCTVPQALHVGYHLTFYPDWLDFWRGDRAALTEKFGSEEVWRSFYGGPEGRETLLRLYREDLDRAVTWGARYVVFHVSDVSVEEGFTYHWRHTHEEVIDAAAEVINLLLGDRAWPFDFLVENQWWPGFTFTEPSSMKPYKTITLRLDAAHYARLTETARTAGLKIEPMLRQLIMGVNLRPRPPDTYAALLRELNAIGNNVNQLAYQANARGAATQDEIREAARLVRQAVRLVRDTL